MHSQQEVRVTTHDKLMRAWENSMELVRDFENYSHQVTDDRQAAQVFAQFAEEESLHAAKLREMLLERQR